MNILENYTVDRFPKHIAIIMDGNGRWATNKGLIRSSGHKEGAKALEKIIKYCKKIGIKYLTVYAFSTENWKRSKLEVNTIMKLFYNYLKEKEAIFKEEDIRVVISGEKENLSKDLLNQIESTTKNLENCNTMVLNIAFNYGGRKEIINSINLMIEKGLEISEENLKNNLYNSFIPDPDLVIRTGNEYRISNFLLWQIAYSEIYISDVLWPDFSEEELDKAILSYLKRDRRYGGIKSVK